MATVTWLHRVRVVWARQTFCWCRWRLASSQYKSDLPIRRASVAAQADRLTINLVTTRAARRQLAPVNRACNADLNNKGRGDRPFESSALNEPDVEDAFWRPSDEISA